MADNTLLKYIFSEQVDVDPEGRFDLSPKTRRARMAEILKIVRKHKLMSSVTPEEFRAMLEDLGPSFVKIGQTLSTRSEILPQAYCDELSKLQAECEPLPFADMLAALDAEYGARRPEIFAEIDPTPLGSASLAQVYRARLASGDQVAVKVQRPGVKATMALDIDIMRMLARRASHVMKDDQFLDLREVVEEMWQTFLEETDFRREAENLEEFARLNEKCVFIGSPHVYSELCTEYVLVMEYVEGIPINQSARLTAAGYDLEEIGVKLLDNYATQVLDHGFFHADPHPGNLIIRGGQIVYIDLGIMGRLSDRDRAGFAGIIKAVGNHDAAELKEALIRFAIQKDNSAIDHTRFLADLDGLLADYGSVGISQIDVGNMLNDIMALTRSCRVMLPSSVTNVARGLVTVEGTVAAYIADQNIVSIINDHLKRTTDTSEMLASALQELALALRASGKGTLEASAYAGETLKMLTRGQLKVNMEMTGSDEPFRKLSKLFTRVTLALIVAGLFMGSSMLSLSSMEPRVLGVPVLAAVGYVSAFLLSVWIVLDIWRRK
ncbi:MULTISPECIES: AarF/ABC1/UbiB kinase family protein [unclassified Adlercreutzia]|uniref:ABC1 kinase family protein n=1 Tax=unclassified Adlercreutzia TaxID=2636013 RepID=UPI0013EB4D07|nr:MULTISPECIES: lipopolysaccharide core heptose(II) kinase RfaY [unclassified Adlercreutzia]